MNIIATILGAVFANNCVLSYGFGASSVLGTAKHRHTRLSLAVFTSCVLFLSSVATFMLNKLVLSTLGMDFLPYFAAILFSVIFGLIADAICSKVCRPYAESRHFYLVVGVLNCAVVGSAIAGLGAEDILSGILVSLGSALGLILVSLVYGAVRERINDKYLPKAFRGLPCDLLVACIMSLAFLALV